MEENISKMAAAVKNEISGFIPETAVILGSGLGGYGDRIKVKYEIKFSEIGGFPVSGVKGHGGKFLFGTLNGKNVAIMSGRVHYYEGFSMREVVLPVRLLKLLGAKNLIVTNAAGGVNPDFEKGDIMAIKDHISLFCPNPLIGPNLTEFGERFPDMSQAYDPGFIEIAKECALKARLNLKEGVYCYLTGPSYETPADVRAAGIFGADSVGMSTVPEVIAARHAGMRVLGFSYIANKGAGLFEGKLAHEDVLSAFKISEKKFYGMLDGIIERI